MTAGGTPTKLHKYQEIAAAVERLVAMTPEGGLLRSDRELAREYGCNVLTVRKALQPFADKGLIVRRPGSGTFRGGAALAPGRDPGRLGVLFHRRADSYAAAVELAFRRAADRAGVALRSARTAAFGADARRAAAAFAADGCGALVVPWAPAAQYPALAAFLRDCPLPVAVTVPLRHFEDDCFEAPEVFGADVDNALSGLWAYFRAQGHREIAYLGPAEIAAPNLQRAVAVYAALASRAGTDGLCRLVDGGAAAMDAVAAAWARRPGLAVIAYDDAHALRFMTAMHKLGRAAPRDYAIVGFNDTPDCRRADPPLASVAHDFAYVGENLLRAAVARAKGGEYQSRKPGGCRLLCRASCGGAATEKARAAFAPYGEMVADDENAR